MKTNNEVNCMENLKDMEQELEQLKAYEKKLKKQIRLMKKIVSTFDKEIVQKHIKNLNDFETKIESEIVQKDDNILINSSVKNESVFEPIIETDYDKELKEKRDYERLLEAEAKIKAIHGSKYVNNSKPKVFKEVSLFNSSGVLETFTKQ
jgi:hypothetical protein